MEKLFEYSIPHKDNFCGGAFPDWLEVNLINECNAKCDWCVEAKGYHPKKIVPWQDISSKISNHGATNIILLGGEPTLYKQLNLLIDDLVNKNKKVWLTTNGSRLTPKFIDDNRLNCLEGINISIHHYDLEKNKEIIKLNLKYSKLFDSIQSLINHNVKVRLNCNCISGYIDSKSELLSYIDFAKNLGASHVRFAELKYCDDFVNLAEILNYEYGLNDDPFLNGCNKNAVISDLPVNFRQMCGLQTNKRPKPPNPQGVLKQVLYYNGILYNGWQTKIDKTIRENNLKLTSEIQNQIEILDNKLNQIRLEIKNK